MNREYKVMGQQNFLKKNGIYYTSKSLAKTMIDCLNIDYTKEFTIIEPAVGEGHIFYLIVEEFLKKNQNKCQEKIKKKLENNFSAFDIREDAIKLCISRLDKLVSKYYNDLSVNWNVYIFDALDYYQKFDKQKKYDYVISNPPYISRKNMGKYMVDKLKKHSEFCNRFNFDIYYYFFELGLSLWNKKGKISYITPNNYLRARGAETLLQTLISNKYIEKIIDYGDLLNFEDATTYTAITVISNENANLEIVSSNNTKLKSFSYDELHNKEIYYLYDEEFMYEGGDSVLLGEIADIKNGLATLQDSVFFIAEEDIIDELEDYYVIEKKSRHYLIEKAILKKGVRVSNLNKNYYTIFPYDDRNQKIITISERYPYTYDYLRNKVNDITSEKNEVEENYRYEAQLLNVLATLQLKISSLSHELHNNRNTIAANPEKIEEALKRKYDWEELKSEKPSSRNIPLLLKNLEKDLEKVLDLSDTIIDENKKERFEPREYSLEVLVEEIVEKWKTQYNWVNFKTNCTGEDIIMISYDYLMIILDNLILNSVQVNEYRKELEISVDFDYNEGKLLLEYSDNGKGLDKKYKNNPLKILNVHEGTREDGHGLGMWMVNNTVYKLNGNISIDAETKGFNLKAEMNI